MKARNSDSRNYFNTKSTLSRLRKGAFFYFLLIEYEQLCFSGLLT
jgi:hypothetical protein